MKRLVSCGDSFMSIDSEYEGTISFLERFCQAKTFEHISLAKSGASNFCIALQIHEAIKRHADYVVIGPTVSDRLDFPKPTESRLANIEKISAFMHDFRRWHQTQWNQRCFNRHDGLSCIEYSRYGSKEYEHPTATTISDSINIFVTELWENDIHHNKDRLIPEGLKEALRQYMLWLYDPEIEQLKDFWYIKNALRELDDRNIPYVFIPGPFSRIWELDWVKGIVWPADREQPWDRPDGFNEDSITHVFNSGHEKLCQTLIDITTEWQ